jgi:cephalosporin-C deacetylase
LPEDFGHFWSETVNDALHAPIDFGLAPVKEEPSDTHEIRQINFRGISGVRLHGWVASPLGKSRCPAFVWLPPYGRESRLPDQYGTRSGFTSLSFNFFGHEAFHREIYRVERGYFSEGATSPESWIIRRMFQDSIIATRVLRLLPEADEDRLAMMGMSQGGGMTIWNAAWNPFLRVACADMPFMGKFGDLLQSSVYRYPTKELTDFMETIPFGKETVLNTVSYFDTVFHAAKSRIPVHISLGEKDPACKPSSVEAVFDALPEPKALTRLNWGHDWHESMVQNNLEWLERFLG